MSGCQTGHPPLDFSQTGAARVAACDVREMKICELCGRNFMRVSPLTQRLGQKHCDPCGTPAARKRLDARLAAEG